jgi:hypothetical protein
LKQRQRPGQQDQQVPPPPARIAYLPLTWTTISYLLYQHRIILPLSTPTFRTIIG